MFRFYARNPYVTAGRKRLGLNTYDKLAGALGITDDEVLDLLYDDAPYEKVPQSALDLAVMMELSLTEVLYVTEDAPDAHRRWVALHAADTMIAEQKAA
ncbi:hypothetical protein AB0M02_13395 [Actinoplanes sp. NPDC051861]|uniref:hypothetical protein n=1 Tax=Actinoplanes sp. NPDC051861 TaxID=3155170 RepID=UPI00341B5627